MRFHGSRRRLLLLLLFSSVNLSSSLPDSPACPYDFSSASRLIPHDCYANFTSIAAAPSPSGSSSSSASIPYFTFSSATSCCWFVFASYLYVAILYANTTSTAFLPDPTATDCTQAFSHYLVRNGLVAPSLLLSGQRCNLAGDPVKFVAGNRPCQFRTVPEIASSTNVTNATDLCTAGNDLFLVNNPGACQICQEAVTTSVFNLLRATHSGEVVACGLATTIAVWAPSLPKPARFRSYVLCMLQVLENIGNLGITNLFPSTPFLSAPPPQFSPLGASPQTSGHEDVAIASRKYIAAGSASAVVFLAAAIWVILTIRKRRRKRSSHPVYYREEAEEDPTTEVMGSPLPTEGLYIFTRSELRQATNGYAPKLVIGEGGAGKVYLGTLPSGQHIAIKRIFKKKKVREFYSEVEVLAKLRHRNLTTLLGYCLDKSDHLLVYEYMPGGNLSKALYHGKLSWHHRVRVAVDVAEGLSYLHQFPEGAVVHRDIKPTNVLLTESGQAKLSDFGVSRIVPAEITHVSTEVKGTRGYVDPEYFSAGQLSEATDVYSFGIVLLELVTGLRAVVPTPSGGAESIVHTAHAVMTAVGVGGGEEPDVSGVVDQRLGEEWDRRTVSEVFQIAYRCVKPYKNDRPGMKEVVTVLKRALAELDAKVNERAVDGEDDVGRYSPSIEATSTGCTPFTSPRIPR